MNLFKRFRKNKSTPTASTPVEKYWEFDETKHFRPRLNKGDFYKLSGFDLGWFLLEPISEYIGDRNGELLKGNTLSYGQKALYYWWYVDAEVNNGGFLQFYYNGRGRYVSTIVKSLQHIGDKAMADLVQKSYEVYVRENKKIEKARGEDLQGFSNLYNEITAFEALDDAYYKMKDATMAQIERYVRQHPNEFAADEDGQTFDTHFTGEVTTHFASGNIKERIPIKNGLVSGRFESFYENGHPKEMIPMEAGIPGEEKSEFYENGQKKFTVTKSEQGPGFLHNHYYENGNLKSQETYLSSRNRTGKWLRYFPNGQIKSECEFIDGDFYVQNCWKDDGTQIMKDGTGIYIHEYESFKGVITRNEEEYLNHKKHGKQYTYYNDILTLYQEMENGKEHGITRSYERDGKLKRETVYENGKKIAGEEFN